MKNKRIIIAGGSGFIGHGLSDYFGTDNDIVILTRRPQAARGRVQYIVWDGRTRGDWAAALEGADLLINLTGKSVNCRYPSGYLQQPYRCHQYPRRRNANAEKAAPPVGQRRQRHHLPACRRPSDERIQRRNSQ
ncbi:hypothetical protein ACTJJB_08680 [Chitinophaga sp. 22536]|uniref:hypothetical protein n=1 Tax=unclassified Chitinophaga TaxID=2619133 RepID=UPI003F82D7D1